MTWANQEALDQVIEELRRVVAELRKANANLLAIAEILNQHSMIVNNEQDENGR